MCAELRGEIDDVEAKVQVVFRSAAADLGLEPHKTVRLESTTQLGHFLRVTKKVCIESSQVKLFGYLQCDPMCQVEKVLRGQRRFSVLETRNDGVRFTNSHLRSLSQQFQCLRERYESTQATLVKEVLVIAAGYSEPLATLSSLLARMDVLVRSVMHVCVCVM